MCTKIKNPILIRKIKNKMNLSRYLTNSGIHSAFLFLRNNILHNAENGPSGFNSKHLNFFFGIY